MKINEIIKERRTALNLTQEQVASYLGVTAPAVNKWEKGGTYPDITILPALARLLDTDLNTLLSFKEELTNQEINCFLNELTTAASERGIDAAFDLAREKLHEYPSCDSLTLGTALTLDGTFMLYQNESVKQEYLSLVETLYERAAESQDIGIRNQAMGMLVSKCMERKEYDKAEKMLMEIPDENSFNKIGLLTKLHMAKGEFAAAAELTERKLLSEASLIDSMLSVLIDIAWKEGRTEDARQIADIISPLSKLLGLWDYNSYLGQFGLSVLEKDADNFINTLSSMLPALLQKWDISASPLYRHLAQKEDSQNLGKMMLPKIIADLEDTSDPEYDFLRSSPKFQEFLNSLKSK